MNGQVEALKWTFNELLLSQGRSVLLLQGDLKMGDEYNISGQAGAVGPDAQAHNPIFNQLVNHIDKSVDFAQLADELRMLREAMTNEAKETSHYIAVGEVAKAEEAAKSKDSSKVIQSLKSAGKWTGDVATKIGVSLAAELIKQSMGLS